MPEEQEEWRFRLKIWFDPEQCLEHCIAAQTELLSDAQVIYKV